MVFEMLRAECEPGGALAGAVVEWVNEATESGEFYDIRLTLPGSRESARRVVFVEVKSTASPTKGVFEVSLNELQAALRLGPDFAIFRLYGVSASDSAAPRATRVVRLYDLAARIRDGSVKLCISV